MAGKGVGMTPRIQKVISFKLFHFHIRKHQDFKLNQVSMSKSNSIIVVGIYATPH